MVRFLWMSVTATVTAGCMAYSEPTVRDARLVERDVSSSNNSSDVAFEIFGRNHPSCVIWTDWQRTCSRLDPKSENLHCNTSAVPVKKTKIFCADRQDDYLTGTPFGDNKETAAAFNRYCTQYRTIDGKKVCYDRKPERPFGGLRVSELRHPLCKTWGSESGRYCTEAPDDNSLPSCGKIASTATSQSPLRCVSFTKPDPEDRCYGLHMPVTKSKIGPPEDGQILNLPDRSAISPLASPYCREWKR